MRRAVLAPIVVVACASLLSCNPRASEDSSAVSLSLSLSGTQQTGGDGKSTTTSTSGFFSDVVDSTTAVPGDDFLTFTVRTIQKSNAAAASDFYTVHLQGYRVVFTRPDGKNTPGVDVPFPLTLPVAGRIAPNGEAEIDLLLVTREMKLQSPLRELWFGEGQRIFATANLTVFGQDLVGNDVSASASSLVIFGDF